MNFAIEKKSKRLLIILLAVPLVLLSLGIYHGLLQTLYRSGMISQRAFAALDYYQGLTLHGVINAIVLTTFFAVAFGHACFAYYLKRPMHQLTATISAGLMIVGTLLAAYAMLTGQASVLYTFYPPLKAHPLFYLGVALLVVGSWVAYFGWIVIYRNWKKDNPEVKMPIPILATLVNFTIWFVCTLPVAYEVLVMLLPWSSGLGRNHKYTIGQNTILVLWSCVSVLLATTGLFNVLCYVTKTGRRKALFRECRQVSFLLVLDLFHSGRGSSSVWRTKHHTRNEISALDINLWSRNSKFYYCIYNCCFFGICKLEKGISRQKPFWMDVSITLLR